VKRKKKKNSQLRLKVAPEQRPMNRRLRISATLLSLAAWHLASGCAPVGPDFVKPDAESKSEWASQTREEFQFESQNQVEWWQLFDDPILNNLVTLAHQNNNNVRVAGLRVLEARAILGIATGSRYPQTQAAFGDATALQASESNANTGAGDLQFTQYNLGLGASWEIDFWGRFRRGIEAADAGLLASIANYDDTLVLLAAQVADVYAVLRTTQEQLRISQENIVLQQRSYDIVDVMYRHGASNELDVQQAEALLLGTQSSIPGLEITLAQSRNALSALLGMPPGSVDAMLSGSELVPSIPDKILVGVPADMLRQRPDVRRAEMLAMAQNAQVGVATANLYPSFSLAGTLGLSAAGNTNTTSTGDSGFSELFRAESLTYSLGASFVWPFLNYGRIKNNIRVEDARLQQSLIQYRETVLQAAREVEDSMVAFNGTLTQGEILGKGVDASRRSTELSMLRYKEGFADYQRVLDSQQRLFSQQQRFISNKGAAVRSLISLYRALGGGWQTHDGSFVDEASRLQMEERVDWDEYLEADRSTIRDSDAPAAE
jgi:NodT family efflux transporter outer membrane factor (OMF) lipoprotein